MASLNPVHSSDLIWQAGGLRVTVFLSEPRDAEKDWAILVGTAPEKVSGQPRAGIASAVGPFGGGVFSIEAQPGRVDLKLGPIQEDARPPDASPIGPFNESCVALVSLASKWLKTVGSPIARIALGCELLHPVESAKQGYEFLAKYLHAVKVDPERTSDLLFAINRPRASTLSIEGLTINRLSRWFLQQMMIGQMVLNEAVPQFRRMRLECIARLELDINTADGFAPGIAVTQSESVLVELATLAREIAREGDMP